jgi:hypothetical protein
MCNRRDAPPVAFSSWDFIISSHSVAPETKVVGVQREKPIEVLDLDVRRGSEERLRSRGPNAMCRNLGCVAAFYFGCEADDPSNVWASNARANPLGTRRSLTSCGCLAARTLAFSLIAASPRRLR